MKDIYLCDWRVELGLVEIDFSVILKCNWGS